MMLSSLWSKCYKDALIWRHRFAAGPLIPEDPFGRRAVGGQSEARTAGAGISGCFLAIRSVSKRILWSGIA